MQCTASETGKRGAEIASPILDKRKGWRDTPHAGHCSPQEISAELIFPLSHPLSLIYLVSQIHDGCGVGRRDGYLPLRMKQHQRGAAKAFYTT